MRREQDNRIYFGHAEEWSLAREMVLAQETLGDDGAEDIFSELYCFALSDDRMLMAPGELAELHEAIHEMLRMRSRHMDALTDGTGEPTPVVAVSPVLTHAERNALAALLYGTLVSSSADHFSALHGRGLIEPIPRPEWVKRGADWYGISAAGRAVLAEQPDPAPDEGWFNNAQILEILAALRNGEHMDEQCKLFSEMRRRDLIALVSGGYYTIASAGQALLAAQTPEAESAPPLDTSRPIC